MRETFEKSAWRDYEASYAEALHDRQFLEWRESGAKQKAYNIVRVCKELCVDSMIEIGCGTGAVVQNLRTLGFANQYVCTDLSVSAASFARSAGISALTICSTADALPFEDQAFTVAVLSHVIEHLADPAAALSEACRIAKFVVVEVPTEKVLSNFIRRVILRRPYASIASAGHVQFWSARSVIRFLEEGCGLEILDGKIDLLSGATESFGKRGTLLVKPFLKGLLKRALPPSFYARVFTTHSTFLCRELRSVRDYRTMS